MLKTAKAIVVEGKYDKIKLSSIIEAEIFTTDGFSIFKNEDQRQLLKLVAEKRGLIILTDSDSAGMMIRNTLKSFIDEKYITHAYIPEVLGKEKRKRSPGAEGIIGVEGMTIKELEKVFLRAGISSEYKANITEKITKLDLYNVGLVGLPNSSKTRQVFLKKQGLPTKISTPAMLTALNSIMQREQFLKIFFDGEEWECVGESASET